MIAFNRFGGHFLNTNNVCSSEVNPKIDTVILSNRLKGIDLEQDVPVRQMFSLK